MTKRTIKGFTLIELIVVIAIIGILAAILVPSMLSYVRNARVSEANANARQVNEAVSAALADMAIARVEFSGDESKVVYITLYDDLTANNEIPYKLSGDYSSTGAYKLDLVAYTGVNFEGVGVAAVDPMLYSVKYCYWAKQKSAEQDLLNAAQEGAFTAETQRETAKKGKIFGCFPLAVSST